MKTFKTITAAEAKEKYKDPKENFFYRRAQKEIMKRISRKCSSTDSIEYNSMFTSESQKRDLVRWLKDLGYRATLGPVTGLIYVCWN